MTNDLETKSDESPDMTYAEAMEIVLDLASQNLISDPDMEEERERQQEAIGVVESGLEDHQKLVTASEEMLIHFAEGVVWSDDQKEAYSNLHVATSRFKPDLARFQPDKEVYLQWLTI